MSGARDGRGPAWLTHEDRLLLAVAEVELAASRRGFVHGLDLVDAALHWSDSDSTADSARLVGELLRSQRLPGPIQFHGGPHAD